MDSCDGSLFRFGREWACEPARVHVFLGHFAQSGMKEAVPTEHPCVQTEAANVCTSRSLHA